MSIEPVDAHRVLTLTRYAQACLEKAQQNGASNEVRVAGALGSASASCELLTLLSRLECHHDRNRGVWPAHHDNSLLYLQMLREQVETDLNSVSMQMHHQSMVSSTIPLVPPSSAQTEHSAQAKFSNTPARGLTSLTEARSSAAPMTLKLLQTDARFRRVFATQPLPNHSVAVAMVRQNTPMATEVQAPVPPALHQQAQQQAAYQRAAPSPHQVLLSSEPTSTSTMNRRRGNNISSDSSDRDRGVSSSTYGRNEHRGHGGTNNNINHSSSSSDGSRKRDRPSFQRGHHGSRSGAGAGAYHDDENKSGMDRKTNGPGFMTGVDALRAEEARKNGGRAPASSSLVSSNGVKRRGLTRPSRSFNPPASTRGGSTPGFVRKALDGPSGSEAAESELPEELKMLDPKLVESISSEMMESPGVKWSDIAGLEFAKKTVMEVVVWPMLKPEIFTGLRGPPKGILLFGPPGTGKTLIGKAIASEASAKFFSISASSLTSKWHGEGEKLVRTLFALASYHQPSIIFIDEIDSLLSSRTDGEFESSRRLKTEFLVQLDGAKTKGDERVLVVGATNRPQELDEAARRRMVKRLYIPLPDHLSREALIRHLLSTSSGHSLSDSDIRDVVARTKGYSGADLKALCTEAAFGPIRSCIDISTLQQDQVRPIAMQDFVAALQQIRPSVGQGELAAYVDWNKTYGSFPIVDPEATTNSSSSSSSSATAAMAD